MPFLFSRIRENIVLFTVIGLIYSLIYNNIQMPDYPFTLPISCGGFLIVALFLHEYFLYSYLNNIGDANVYLLTNLVSYGVYIVLFYIIFFFSMFNISFFRTVYEFIFRPYDVFAYLGTSRGVSTLLVHIIYIASIILTPYFVKDNSVNPLEEYLNREE